MNSWLQDNDMEMYSAHNKGKSVVAERFIRTLKNKIYNYATSVSNKLVETLNKQYNQNDPC